MGKRTGSQNVVELAVADKMTNFAETSSSPAENQKPEPMELRLPSVLVGRIAAIAESGEVLVDFPGNDSGTLVSGGHSSQSKPWTQAGMRH